MAATTGLRSGPIQCRDTSVVEDVSVNATLIDPFRAPRIKERPAECQRADDADDDADADALFESLQAFDKNPRVSLSERS